MFRACMYHDIGCLFLVHQKASAGCEVHNSEITHSPPFVPRLLIERQRTSGTLVFLVLYSDYPALPHLLRRSFGDYKATLLHSGHLLKTS